MNKKSQLLLIIFVNGLIVSILIILQLLIFAFLPAISPHNPLPDQKNIAINFVLKKCEIALIELTLGLLVSFLINWKLFKLPFRKNILIVAIELTIVLFSLLMFSLNYINKFD